MKQKNLKPCRGNYTKLLPLIDYKNNTSKWLQDIGNKNSIIVLDLFSGAGGLGMGFENAGFFVAAAIDSDEYSCETYSGNFNSKVICCNIAEIKEPKKFIKSLGIPRVDVIIGGPPCQGFSTEGRGKIKSLNKTIHYHNGKNKLYRQFIRFVEELKPLYFLMENVPGMETHYSENGTPFSEIIEEELKITGYRVERRILDSSHFGVPQIRKRLFFMGCRKSLKLKWPETNGNGRQISLREAIGDLPSVQPPCFDEEQKYRPGRLTLFQKLMRSGMNNGCRNLVFDHIIREVRKDDKIIFRILPEGGKYTEVPEKYRRYRCDIFKDKYRKLKWDTPCQTIAAHIAKDGYRYIHPDSNQMRTLSIREVARIQSFPDRFRFAGYRTNIFIQIGNAVPPLLSETLAQCVKEELLKSRKKP